MSHLDPRGSSSARSRASVSRSGRSRGKSQRARGSKRGLRIPPEYLAQVIAQREGRDTNDIENALEDDVDEEEVKAFYAKFAARPLESNEAKYDEPIDGSSGVEDEEDDTNEILARHLQKQRDELIASPDYIQEKKIQKNSTLDDDVDHELGETLREISIRGSKYNIGSKGDTYNDTKKKKLEIQWTPELEKMSREKAEAEARTALKERLKSSAVRGSGIKPRPAGPAPHSKALGNKPEMEDLEDYLDDLLR